MKRTLPSLVLTLATAATLAVAPPAHARRTIKLTFPSFTVPPRSDREVCTFVRLPRKKPFDLGGSVIKNVGTTLTFVSHHFLLWAYEGTDLAGFPPDGQIVDSKACLDFGPADTNQRALIALSQLPTVETRIPKGLALQIKPTVSDGQQIVGLILNSHWINGTDAPQQAAVKIKLMEAKKHTVRQYLLPIFDVVADAFIKVPPPRFSNDPASEVSVAWAWRPGGTDLAGSVGGNLGGGAYPTGPACVTSLTSHMHKRGVHFTIDLLDGDQVMGGHLLETVEYTDPPMVPFQPAMLVKVGQGLRYTCTHDNGVNGHPLKMGCEETAGQTPGVDAVTALFSRRETSGAAKRCATDADCQGFGTGKCVPANLVFGFTSDDDMCIMPGSWYPVNPTTGDCSLKKLKLLN